RAPGASCDRGRVRMLDFGFGCWSKPAVPTSEIQHPTSIFTVTRASFNGSGHPATNRETWRFESSRPYHFRLVVQGTGRSPPKAEIPVRPRTGRPIVEERRPTGEAPGCLPGAGEFDSPKSPVSRAGHRGFEPRHRCHWA